MATFIKFCGFSGLPYHPVIEAGFRIFWALCPLGAEIDLRRRLLGRSRPGKFYWDTLIVATAWFIVIVSLVKTVEWIGNKRRARLTR